MSTLNLTLLTDLYEMTMMQPPSPLVFLLISTHNIACDMQGKVDVLRQGALLHIGKKRI